ncbi:hypothetical protein AB6A23_24815 [Paenibacillus tarimensis]
MLKHFKRVDFMLKVIGIFQLHISSLEIALVRFDEVTEDKTCPLHVLVRVDGKVIAECIPLVVDGAPVKF